MPTLYINWQRHIAKKKMTTVSVEKRKSNMYGCPCVAAYSWQCDTLIGMLLEKQQERSARGVKAKQTSFGHHPFPACCARESGDPNLLHLRCCLEVLMRDALRDMHQMPVVLKLSRMSPDVVLSCLTRLNLSSLGTNGA